MNSKTTVAVFAMAATLLAVPLVASAESDSPSPGGYFHSRWADQMDAQDTMMSGMDHETMMSGMDHDTMMSGDDMGTMMSGDDMGAMDPGGMSPGGMTAADPAGHDGHHGSDSTQSESP